MCLSPLKIRNNSRSFEQSFYPLYREVPCGHCLECQQAVQNDWFVRLAYEWFDNTDKGGTSLLLTITYNKKNRPFFNVTNEVCEILSTGLKRLVMENDEVHNKVFDFECRYGISAYDYRPFSHHHFDRQDLSKFFKSLRQILDYKGIFKYTDKDTLKFFCASEYGHETHLPHYHVTFFLPFKISPAEFMDCCRWAWSYSVKRVDLPDFIAKILKNKQYVSNNITNVSTPNGKNWCDWFIKSIGSHVYVKNLRGFLSYSKKYPAEISSVQGLKYIVKYVSKKDDYLRKNDWLLLSDYLALFPRSLADYRGRFPKLCDYVTTLRSYFPRVHSSNFLGISILREFECLSDDDISKMCVEHSLSIAGENRKFPVPAYIVNRVMYRNDDVDNTLRKLTPVGVKVLRYRLDLRVQEFVKNIEFINDALKQFVTPSELEKIQNDCRLTTLFTPNYEHLAYYKYFFQNVELSNNSLFLTDTKAVIDTFCYQYFDKLLNRVYDTQSIPANIQPQAVKIRHRHTWNYQPCFEDFDKFLEYYSILRSLVMQRKAEKRKKEYLEIQRLRKLYNEPLFVPF